MPQIKLLLHVLSKVHGNKIRNVSSQGQNRYIHILLTSIYVGSKSIVLQISGCILHRLLA